MDIRLKILALSAIASCFCSCKTAKTATNAEEEGYVEAYKKSILTGCLDELTNNRFTKLLVENNDLIGSTEVATILHAEYEIAYNLGKAYAPKIQPIDYADAEGRRPGFSYCVSYAFSKEIDSIARVEYKRTQRAELRYEYD